MEKTIGYFKPPDIETCRWAYGSLAGEKFSLKKYLSALFDFGIPIPAPNESDWLWDHDEDG